MIEIVILAVIAFVISLIFDRPAKNSKSKIMDRFKKAGSSSFTVIVFGIVILFCIALFLIICRFIIFGDIRGFFT